ncbi:Gfo/Idh/MocA family protein [Bacillus marinisedimentorum]|uniref:Gfo/Idh/MocA family protein n=1 Tax=Bacillus marinisedimentorum TaxID=1821260 RepID=UPI0007DF55C2|nr:Gfo/Idh/MocA family oxidoreductase [Bacillus marinisedimentorum]
MQTIRWGVLSTANIALTKLIPAMQQAEHTEVLAISSLSGKAKDTAQELGIHRAYDRYEELLNDPDIDAVYIPLPNHLHKNWVEEAARHGKHVLCEKPAGLTSSEVQEMAAVCHEHDVIFMEAFMYQFHPQHERVREIIDSGEIGEVKLIKASFSFYLDNPDQNIRMYPAKGGGSLYDVGSYCLHVIRKFGNGRVLDVTARASFDLKYEVDTSAAGVITFETGVLGVFDCSFELNFRHEYEIAGSKGSIKVPRAFRPDVHDGEGIILVEAGGKVREEKVKGDQYRLEVEHFSQTIREKGIPFYSAEETLENMKLIDACYHSIKNHAT